MSETEIVSRAIETVASDRWNEVGPLFCELTLTTADLNRADELLAKARSGTITTVKRQELEKYLRVGNFLDLMKARALRELRRTRK
jgi:hypothetical protein